MALAISVLCLFCYTHQLHLAITRPLYIYVNKFSYNTKPVVKEFVKFYMEQAAKLITEIGYVPVKDEEYKSNLDKVR